MIKFNKLKMINFGPFIDEEIDLLNGIKLVIGDNGVGKSFLLDKSFRYCLFGDTAFYIDDIVNSKIQKDCMVEIQLSDNDNKYIIRRYRKHSIYKNSLVILKNDELISNKKNLKDNQIIVNELIDPVIFEYLFIFRFENIIGFYNKPNDNLFIRFFNLNLIDSYITKIKEIIKTKTKEKEILDNKIIYIQENFNLSKVDFLETNNRITFIERTLIKNKNIINSFKTVERNKEEIIKNNKILEQIEFSKAQKGRLLLEKRNNIEQLEQFKTDNKTSINEMVKKLKEEINSLPKETICKKCNILTQTAVKINTIYKKQIVDATEYRRKTIDKFKIKIVDLDDKLLEVEKIIKDCTSKLTSNNFEMPEESSVNTETIKNDIIRLTTHLEHENKSKTKLQKDQEKYNDELSNLTTAINIIQLSLDDYNKLNENIIFIKTTIIQNIKSLLSKYIKQYLPYFNLTIKTDIDDNLSVEFDKNEFNKLSDGQKLLTILCKLLSTIKVLQQLSNDKIFEPIIFDEVLDMNLSNANKVKMISLIEREFKNILMSTHDDIYKDMNFNTLNIIKVDDYVSKIN